VQQIQTQIHGQIQKLGKKSWRSSILALFGPHGSVVSGLLQRAQPK
jgi:hypothetical protein